MEKNKDENNANAAFNIKALALTVSMLLARIKCLEMGHIPKSRVKTVDTKGKAFNQEILL